MPPIHWQPRTRKRNILYMVPWNSLSFLDVLFGPDPNLNPKSRASASGSRGRDGTQRALASQKAISVTGFRVQGLAYL